MSQTLDELGVSDIDMVEITIQYPSVSYMTYDDLHTLERCDERLREDRSKRTHWNQCIVCYRYGNFMLSMYYFESGKNKSLMFFSDHEWMLFGKENP